MIGEEKWIEVRPLDREGLLSVQYAGGQSKVSWWYFKLGGDSVSLEYPYEAGRGRAVPVEVPLKDLRKIVDLSVDRTGGSRLFVNRERSCLTIEPMAGYHANIGFKDIDDRHVMIDERFGSPTGQGCPVRRIASMVALAAIFIASYAEAWEYFVKMETGR